MTCRPEIEEGDKCPCGCGGRLGFGAVEDCSCHISPPCQACVSNPLRCDECGWTEEDGIITNQEAET